MSDADTDTVATQLKAAMRRMPGPVSLITTCDASGKPAGMAASAVIPVSMDPPSMLIAINRGASMHAVLGQAQRFCINLLTTEQTGLVKLFSSPDLRESRFAGDDWAYADGLPWLPTACASIVCTVASSVNHGTHELFIGSVQTILGGSTLSNEPLGWIDGGFARMTAID